MARDTDVGGRSIASLWRGPIAGGRSLDGWFDERTERLLKAIAHKPVRLAITLLIFKSDAQYLAEHLRRLKDITNDPRVVEALRVANLPKEELT
jgi:hypothetical protein